MENYVAIYRRFRPETFDKVLGQKHVVNVLKHQIMTDSTSHAYLFSGTRGTGKTTMARLLAKGLNCLSDGDKPCGVCANCIAIKDGTFIDVIEIDAASNNGVDNVRDIRDIVVYPPTVGKKRVFIIDEVHMFSGSAANALLKTLEEPPENTVFILATTDPGKLPATIRSRCLHFEFKRVPSAEITAGMKEIVSEMQVSATDDALSLIAAAADGSVRDGLSILEQCIALSEGALTREVVLDAIGSAGDEEIMALTLDVHEGKTAEALLRLNKTIASGKEVRRIMEDWIDFYRSALLVKYLEKPENILSRSLENIVAIKEKAAGLSEEEVTNAILKLSKLYNEGRWSAHPGILLEMAIIELSQKEDK
ncbi:MAG: DNA polymerase III subunit gamma/tau [Clostridiales Family XIII bacterium]|jgi:DNA polymerase-3 subunit gamma/tau|nr:DNA polymerase III subunit gamma/tau [Clostridiales Family XIII bacterium]